MNRFPVITAAAIGMSLAGCETFNQPISGGDFDPLRPPGSNINLNTNTAPMFKAGQFVRAAMDSTAFYKNRPKGEADADKLLPRGTSMKVISVSDSYVKVELDSGEVGFVPTVMVEDPNAAAAAAAMPPLNPGEYQVYPPLGGFGDPLPVVPPGEAPPEGAIPTVIDPEAPVGTTPVPPVTPPGDTFPAPAEQPVPDPAVTPAPGPAPLPPNQDEIEAQKKATEATPKLEE
jgi:hypothetical protein